MLRNVIPSFMAVGKQSRRASVLHAAMWATLACSLFAQDSDTPVFRTGTRLVQVDVVVKSKGVPVAGLTKDDFQVFDNGKPQPISIFSIRAAGVPLPVLKPLPAGVVANRPLAAGPEPVSATVILLDSENTPIEFQSSARLEALKYLARSGPLEAIAVYALDIKLSVLQEFTSDRAALRRAVEGYKVTQSFHLQDDPKSGLLAGIKGNAANAARLNNFQRQAEITSAAFAAVASHLKGLPGRKKLIWISAGMPLTVEQDNERNLNTMTEFSNLSPAIFAPMKWMNDANVAIYPIDPRGGAVCLPPNLCMADPNITTMLQLAQMTGGKAAYIDNGVAESLEQAVHDTDLTYTLGYYSPEEKADGKDHSISVKVNRSNMEIRNRKSYSLQDETTPPTAKVLAGTLSTWVQQPLDSTEISLQAAAVPSINKPGYYDVEVAVDVTELKLQEKNGRFVGSFEVAIVPDVDTKPKGLHQTFQVNLTPERLQVAVEQGILVVNQIRMTNAKGKLLSHKIHIVVMDKATGKTGSVRVPIAEQSSVH